MCSEKYAVRWCFVQRGGATSLQLSFKVFLGRGAASSVVELASVGGGKAAVPGRATSIDESRASVAAGVQNVQRAEAFVDQTMKISADLLLAGGGRATRHSKMPRPASAATMLFTPQEF